ncbi:MAG: hypothetical protein Kow00117_18940 [Phototrophicales bacterium]
MAEDEFSKADRDAMRAYLARSEVRLSTMRRIALGFINGAGLLLLFPIFFKDVITVIIRTFLNSGLINHFPELGQSGEWLSLLLFGALFFPFVVSIAIPVHALYLLLKDILHFYFTVYTPGFPTSLNNPTFTLNAIAFSPDESPTVKEAVLQRQYQDDYANFMTPLSTKRRKEYLEAIIEQTNGDIMPPTRRNMDSTVNVQHLNAAFGLARLLDRQLVEEVAAAEVMLTRSVLYLRRLVLRYLKTLLVFIWTTMISFIMMPFLQDPRFNPVLILGVGYVLWSVLAFQVIHLPIHWMYRFNRQLEMTARIDRQIILLEINVRWWIYASIGSSLLGLGLALWSVM